MQRQFDADDPEWMDRPDTDPTELATDLENLRKLNAWFGSHALVWRFLRRWLDRGRPVTVCDLATGYGDIPRLIASRARNRGWTVRVDAVDIHPKTLEIARRASENLPEIRFVLGDARTFTPDETYDIVLCSLALHHFSEEDAIRILARARAASHDAVLVADLERSRWAALGIELLVRTVFREPMTAHDARVSIRRAFSFREMASLAERAGWTAFGHRRFPVARQAIWEHVAFGAAEAAVAAAPVPAT